MCKGELVRLIKSGCGDASCGVDSRYASAI